MAFVQTTFMGLSISNFQASAGWNEQSSTLEVELVQDISNGDVFAEPVIGGPAYFNYQGWKFGGIVQDWKYRESISGRLYSVQLSDPRELLDNVQIIIGGYAQTTHGIPNLINPYGYLENLDFGSSKVNDGGMPWNKIVEGINDIFAGSVSTFGGPISFRGFEYQVDLTSLPTPSDHYRLGGNNITLLDAITQVARDHGGDFTVDLINIAGVHIIKVNYVSRIDAATTGLAAGFIGTEDNGPESREIGLELRNDVTTSFLVGSPVDLLYQQEESFTDELTSEDITTDWLNQGRFFDEVPAGAVLDSEIHLKDEDINDGNIWPYWGLNPSGNVIKGITFKSNFGYGDPTFYNPTLGDTLVRTPLDIYHQVEADSSNWDVVGVGTTYKMSIGEMRCALQSQSSWEDYIHKRDQFATLNSLFGDPYYGRSVLFNLSANYITGLEDETRKIAIVSGLLQSFGRPISVGNLDRQNAIVKSLSTNFDVDKNLSNLYNLVRQFASEYYGKKYMVRAPIVKTAIEPDTRKTIFNYDITQSAFVSSSGAALGLNDVNSSVFKDKDGKIQAVAKFLDASGIDQSNLNRDSYVVQDGNLFIKCSVDPEYVFENYSTKSDPRAVITLDAPILHVKPQTKGRDAEEVLDKHVGNKVHPNLVEKQIQNLAKMIGRKGILSEVAADAPMPVLVGIPLRSNRETYGPWFKIGANGKVNFEQNESLAPWNFNGYSLLDTAGDEIVSRNTSNMQFAENGIITVPRVPEVQIGQVLVSNGPRVTNVQVNVHPDGGVKTTYTMQSFTPRFGELSRKNIDRLQRLSKARQEQRLENKQRLRDQLNVANLGTKKLASVLPELKKIFQPERDKPGTPHEMFMGEIVTAINGSGQTANVVSETIHEAIPDFQAADLNLYRKRAGMSLDGLLVPFSTNVNASGLPKYESVTSTGSGEINRNDLDPFVTGHNIEFIARGSEYPEDSLSVYLGGYDASGDYRPLALRGPLMICGPGYDINDNPVPSDGDGGFAADYRSDPNNWPVGPLDVRWDNDKKVWSAAGGTLELFEGFITQDLAAPSSSLSYTVVPLEVYDIDSSGNFFSTNTYKTAVNRDIALTASSGVYAQIAKYKTEYRFIWVSCNV